MKPASKTRTSLAAVIILASLLFSPVLLAQGMPTHQVWLLPLVNDVPGAPKLISQAVRYNNQPHFSADSRVVYFTAEQEDEQTDVWSYDIASERRSAISHSPESEFSPTPMPGLNAVSVIRVEADQRQRLWSINTDDGEATLLMPDVEPVGYHAWISEDTAALFILGDVMTLHRSKRGKGPSVPMAENIGRTLRRHPATGEALYVDKNLEPWWISAMDFSSRDSTRVMPLFPGVEDFEVDSAGRFWTGSGSKIYRSHSQNSQWGLLMDLKEYGLDNISRLAVSPDGAWLAIVVSP